MFRLLTGLFILVILLISTAYPQEFEFFEPKSTIGGYGELHYNYSHPEGEKVSKILDFHRFVLFFGHSFSEKWSFKSEVELEHNVVQENSGELELEQAYVDYHHSDYFGFQAGVIFPSAGLMNEYHEPPLFFGVERPGYNRVIIPTTWFGNGVAVYGNVEGFDYKVTVMEGLNSDKFSASSGIREGRVKGYLAKADHLLYNIRMNFIGAPGLLVGASYTTNKAKGDSTTNDIGLLEFHGKYDRNNLIASAEYGMINYGSGNIELSRGYYFDIGYNIGGFFKIPTQIIPFVRYTDINTAAETISGGNIEKQYHFVYWMAGLSVKPLPQIVFKFDYGVSTNQLTDLQTTLINLGAGYMF